MPREWRTGMNEVLILFYRASTINMRIHSYSFGKLKSHVNAIMRYLEHTHIALWIRSLIVTSDDTLWKLYHGKIRLCRRWHRHWCNSKTFYNEDDDTKTLLVSRNGGNVLSKHTHHPSNVMKHYGRRKKNARAHFIHQNFSFMQPDCRKSRAQNMFMYDRRVCRVE